MFVERARALEPARKSHAGDDTAPPDRRALDATLTSGGHGACGNCTAASTITAVRRAWASADDRMRARPRYRLGSACSRARPGFGETGSSRSTSVWAKRSSAAAQVRPPPDDCCSRRRRSGSRVRGPETRDASPAPEARESLGIGFGRCDTGNPRSAQRTGTGVPPSGQVRSLVLIHSVPGLSTPSRCARTNATLP